MIKKSMQQLANFVAGKDIGLYILIKALL